MFRDLILCILLLISLTGRADHLVGGEISYTCIGNNNYEITLTIYRDCFSNGAPFDPQANVTIFNASGTIIENLRIPLLSSSRLPLTSPNDCSTISNVACTEMGIYKMTIFLPPLQGGYTISHQRCCRNSTIANITNPNMWGNTYTISIPSDDISCNSSPAFDSVPPVALCHNQKFRLDMSATDPDGDSLSYELCQLLHGGGQSTGTGPNSPAPAVALPPPYTTIPFSTGHTFDNPITSNPAINIDPRNGVITGRPTNVGQYVFAVCVSEYRNGQLLSTLRRDFQFNVTGSCTGVISLARNQQSDPSSLCIGKTISFTNQSVRANTYFWDFGDPNKEGDTSRAVHPTYTYDDTGTYRVTLIADPGSACADTNSWLFRVYNPVDFRFTHNGGECFDNHFYAFEADNNYSPDATYTWDFGTQTNIGRNSSDRSPDSVVFPQPGSYTVTLSIRDKGCEGTYQDIINIYPDPQLDHSAPAGSYCLPVSLQFTDNSSASGDIEHYWNFGDGTTSVLASPVHTYSRPGLYWVEHSITTADRCRDSLYERFTEPIEIYEKPKARISASPSSIPIYQPITSLRSSDSGATHTITHISDGRSIQDLSEESIIFPDTGVYFITHIAYNGSGCSDTTFTQVTVQALLDIYIPNAFTPNSDGINDHFELKIMGIESYYISIFNRWGEMVFQSDDIGKSWNGEKMNSSGPVPEGIYTYRVIVESRERPREIERFGTVQLIR